MNKKQATVTVVLLGLMVILALFQGVFRTWIEGTTLASNDLGNLKSYIIENSDYEYNLPEDWKVNKEEQSKYIIYNANFSDESKMYNGTIQLINSKDELKDIAYRDNKNSSMYTKLIWGKEFKCSIGNGYKNGLSVKTSNGVDFIYTIYYIRVQDDKVLKITFIEKEKEYDESHISLYDSIVSQIKKKS